jgi:hypothetical protein
MTASARKLVFVAALALALALPASAQAAGGLFEYILFTSGLSSPYTLPSQDFTDNTHDSQAADDFTVPPGQNWRLTEVDPGGRVFGGPPSVVNVSIYASAGSTPGQEIFRENGIVATSQPNYRVRLNGAPELGPGTYWVSAVESGGTYPTDRWEWYTTPQQSGHPAVFRAPNAVGCVEWTPTTSCFSSVSPDMVFWLIGTSRADLLSFGKLRRLKNGTARLAVSAPGAGAVALSGKGVKEQASFVNAPSTVVVRIKPTGRAKKILDARGKVTVKAKLTFQAFGAAQWTPQTRKVKLAKR